MPELLEKKPKLPANTIIRKLQQIRVEQYNSEKEKNNNEMEKELKAIAAEYLCEMYHQENI